MCWFFAWHPGVAATIVCDRFQETVLIAAFQQTLPACCALPSPVLATPAVVRGIAMRFESTIRHTYFSSEGIAATMQASANALKHNGHVSSPMLSLLRC
jgi:hypothetical protein